MLHRGSGTIVLVASDAGFRGGGGLIADAPYAASKAGVLSLVKSVARVLAGKPEVVGLAADTVRRVHAAAKELGYVADPAALRLARRQNYLLGVHTFSATFPVDIENSYYPFLAGIEEQAGARGYDIVLF